MTVLKVVINSLADAAIGKKIVETATPDNIVVCDKPMTFAFLEGGMVSGKTSVMVVMIAPDGKHYMGECSGENFEMAHAAFLGAKARFGQ